ncbi:MarR family winged helix-turn-helix transcriptional regulator [Hydrogenophaga flava]|uniref:MarR family winged helix-turn-helix transcriptional regulator n=1 Tax=Hydrogenophaga flava TaxID=65657 RepID=UPI000B106D8D
MATSRLGDPQSIEDLLLYRLIRLVSVAGSPVIRMCEGQHGITRREWRVMAVLQFHGPSLSSELADRAGLDHARTSRAITGLVEKKLLDRMALPGDRRRVRISLTPAGAALYAQLFPEVVQLNQEILSVLRPEEMDVLDDLINRLQARAVQHVAEANLPKANRRRGRLKS